MNRKDDGGSHVDELMGLVIGAVGVLCVWLGGAVGTVGAGGVGQGFGGWVSDTDGELRWFDGGGWFGTGSEVYEEYREDPFHGDEFPGKRVVMLVHGLDEPGGIWDEVAPELDDWGYQVVRFDYPNDQAVVLSAEGLVNAVGRLSGIGVEHVDIVAHSMGGLVSREALTNLEMGASSGKIAGVLIGRLILVGTPNEGSAWARMRGVAEVREHVQRWMASDDMDLSILGSLGEDGDGQAGIDLLPGSDFLVALNSRPMPESVEVTCIVGRVVDPAQTRGMGAVDTAAEALGDGVVSVESASLDGCADVVLFVANHRSLIRTIEAEEGWRAMMGFERAARPEGIRIILDRLESDDQ